MRFSPAIEFAHSPDVPVVFINQMPRSAVIVEVNLAPHASAQAVRRPWFRRHPALVLLALNLGLLVIGAMSLELGLRVASPAWLTHRMEFLRAGGKAQDWGSDGSWKVIRRNGRFLQFEPHSELKIVHPEYSNSATIDDLGGRQVIPRRASDYVVPCLGDSFTFGIGVNDGETFVDHLQAGANARLLNLGVPGSALPNQRYIVESRHADLGRPKQYLAFFFLGNDFADILNRRAQLQAAAQQSDPGAVTKDVVVGSGKSRGYRALTERANAVVNATWLRRSYAIQFLKRSLMDATTDKRQNPVFLMMNRNNEAYHREARLALSEEFDAWNALASANGFQLTVVMVPDCYQVSRARREQQARYYRVAPSDLDPLLPNSLLKAILDEKGIKCIDCTSQMMELPEAGDLYYINDNHFNSRGHAEFAAIIRDQVTAKIMTDY